MYSQYQHGLIFSRIGQK